MKSASHLFGLWRKEGVLRKNTTAEHAIGRETDHGVLVPIQVDNQDVPKELTAEQILNWS